MQKQGKILASWQFLEFQAYQRTKAWYIWATLIGGGLFIWAIVTYNILFALIILLFGLILLLHEKKKPQEIEFKITEDGLKIGQKFYPYKEIKSFYIIYEPPEVKNLYFQFKSSLRPRLSIPLENQNPLEIRKLLLKYLEEDLEKDTEPFSERLGRILKL